MDLRPLASKPKYCHNIVMRTAKDLAGAFYEDAARDNDFYFFFPKQRQFIEREWWRFIPLAKDKLVDCLASIGLADVAKEDIADALIKQKHLETVGGTA